jgi:hypothetical protein
VAAFGARAALGVSVVSADGPVGAERRGGCRKAPVVVWGFLVGVVRGKTVV